MGFTIRLILPEGCPRRFDAFFPLPGVTGEVLNAFFKSVTESSSLMKKKIKYFKKKIKYLKAERKRVFKKNPSFCIT